MSCIGSGKQWDDDDDDDDDHDRATTSTSYRAYNRDFYSNGKSSRLFVFGYGFVRPRWPGPAWRGMARGKQRQIRLLFRCHIE